MSLEAKIELLTAAVEALTLMLSERTTVRPIVEPSYTFPPETRSPNHDVIREREPSFTEQVSAVTAVQQLINEREKEIVASEVKAGNESSITQSGSQSEPEQTKSFTYDDVKRATYALSAAKGKEVAIAALAHFGVTRATQLTDAQWGDYVAHCEKAAA